MATLRRAGSFIFSAFLVTGFYLSVTLREAHAYIDIASNAYIIQILLGVFFASLFMVKSFWQKITTSVSRFYSKLRTTKTNSR